MKSVYVMLHLGCGDGILCNALLRKISEDYDLVQFPCYLHNYETMAFMFRDNPKIQPVAIKDEADALAVCKESKCPCIKLGYYNEGSFNPNIFDQEFYRHAGVPFEERWSGFKMPYVNRIGLDEPMIFVHSDIERGFNVDFSPHINKCAPIYFADKSRSFFDHLIPLQDAFEIHCFNSSFLILADSLPDDPKQKLFFHKYARPTPHPTLKRRWTIL